jgi:hypothetical protein
MTEQEAAALARMILDALAGDRLKQLTTAILNAHASGYAAGCRAEARLQEERRSRDQKGHRE